MMIFEIQRIDGADFQVLSVSGYMGNENCTKFEAELEQLCHHGHRLVIIDFTALTFVTGASLARPASQTRWFQSKGGEIRLCGLSTSATRD
jgi:anti-anti-sigma regulatory factor